MALAIGGVGVGVDESSAPRGKGFDAFAVKREVFAVGEMSIPARRLLRKRLGSELDAVRDLLSKAEFYSCGAGAAGGDGRLSAPEAPVEEDGCRAANRRKVSPFAALTGASKPDDRERLAGRLASMAAVLPDHVVAFLQNRRAGDADSGADNGALFQLKMLLDKFAPEESTAKSHGRRAPLLVSGTSCLSQHPEAGDKMAPVQEEEGVDICGGVSRIAIRDIAEEYGELVEDIGVHLLSPLQRKYVDLAEQDEYVDICGYASPVVFPNKAGDSSSSSSSPSLSSSGDSDYSDSSSSSPDSSDSEGDPYKSVISSRTSPPAFPPKEKDTYAQAPEPTPEELPALEPLDLQHKCAPPENDTCMQPPAPEILPKENDKYGQPPEPAPEATQTAEPEYQCAPTVFPVIKSPPAPTALPTERGALAQPSEPAPEAAQIAEPKELQDKCVATAATVHHITGENGTSSQPPPVPPPVAAPPQIAQPPPPPVPAPAPQIAQPQPQPPPPQASSEINDLIAVAREKEKRRAIANAREKLVEVERAALPDERIHPMDMELLGITAFEHIVSTVRDSRTAQPQVNNGAGFRVSPGHPSILQQLGLFLKADDGGEEEEEEQPPPMAVASGGEDMEIEDGEIH